MDIDIAGYFNNIFHGKLLTRVRYADGMVILCEKKTQALDAIQVLKAVFGKLELTMNS